MENYQFDWSVVTSGKYFEWLLKGVWLTMEISTISIVLAFLLGLLIAVMRLSSAKSVAVTAKCYLEFIRNTPLLVQIFFWYFGSYQILPTFANNWIGEHNFEYAAAIIALTVYTSAFIAEDIRSGIRSIPKEQMEASRAAGFSYLGAMLQIILPQAIRITIPPLINQFLNLIKNSSLAMVIGVAELTYQARQIESYTFKSFEAFTAATLVYLIISLVFTALLTFYNKRVLSVMRTG